MFHEHGLQGVNDRTLEADGCVAPVRGILSIAEPLVGNPVSAGVADLAVHHEDLAMSSMVQQPQVPESWRAVHQNVGATRTEL